MRAFGFIAVLAASPVWAQDALCPEPDDMTGNGILVDFGDGDTAIHTRRADGLIQIDGADNFGTYTETLHFGLYLIEGVETDTKGNRSTYAEEYGGDIAPPPPGSTIKTRSTSYSNGERVGAVSTIWTAQQPEEIVFGGCTFTGYRIEDENTPMNAGATAEQRRYFYLSDYGTAIFIASRFVDDDWARVPPPSIRRVPD